MEPIDSFVSENSFFAPADRDSVDKVHDAREAFLANQMAVTLLESIPDPAVVLNDKRQTVAVNSRFLQLIGAADPEELEGLRPGEAMGCIHADECPGGCGTSRYCMTCGAVNAVLETLNTHEPITHECRISTRSHVDGGALDLLVQATFAKVGDFDLVVVAFHDISADKRRQVLERVFFHDVLNTAGGIQAIAYLLHDGEVDSTTETEYKEDLIQLSQAIVDEIAAHRQLIAAEKGDLHVEPTEVSVPDLLDFVISLYRHHEVAEGRRLELGSVPNTTISTDITLLRRVLGNLVKNALEATPRGGTVRISAQDMDGQLAFMVENPGVIPEDVQLQIFQRSFSTKGGNGRGIGTYSIKLFTEKYLNGEVDFISHEPEGTTFTVLLPKYLKRQRTAQE